MSELLLDSDIFSDVLRGRNKIVLARERDCRARVIDYALSTITVIEIIKGLHKAGRGAGIQDVLKRFSAVDLLTLDLESAEAAGRILADLEQTGQTIGYADPMIAAIALRHDLTLVTGNVSHYERIRELGYPLRLDNWRSPVPLVTE